MMYPWGPAKIVDCAKALLRNQCFLPRMNSILRRFNDASDKALKWRKSAKWKVGNHA